MAGVGFAEIVELAFRLGIMRNWMMQCDTSIKASPSNGKMGLFKETSEVQWNDGFVINRRSKD